MRFRKQDLPFIGSSYNFVGAERGDVGVSMYLVEAQPGRGAPLHVHPYDEIVVIEQGVARFVCGEETFEACAGDVLVVKAHTPHGFVNCGTEILKQVDVHVSPVFQQQNLEPTDRSRAAGLPIAAAPASARQIA